MLLFDLLKLREVEVSSLKYTTNQAIDAAKQGELEIVKNYIENSDHVNIEDPMVHAAKCGHTDIVLYLLELQSMISSSQVWGMKNCTNRSSYFESIAIKAAIGASWSSKYDVIQSMLDHNFIHNTKVTDILYSV